jgi:hypothetical protein
MGRALGLLPTSRGFPVGCKLMIEAAKGGKIGEGLAGRQENELTIAVMLGFAPNGQYASHQTSTGRASIYAMHSQPCVGLRRTNGVVAI